MRGHYLGDQNLIEAMTKEAPERVLELEKYGAKLLPVNYVQREKALNDLSHLAIPTLEATFFSVLP